MPLVSSSWEKSVKANNVNANNANAIDADAKNANINTKRFHILGEQQAHFKISFSSLFIFLHVL